LVNSSFIWKISDGKTASHNDGLCRLLLSIRSIGATSFAPIIPASFTHGYARLFQGELDSEGNTTELGELIADDKAIDLDAWVSSSTWEIGYPKRLVEIAYKLKAGEALTHYERNYLWRFRQQEQKYLFQW
jgi:hypothetical protein